MSTIETAISLPGNSIDIVGLNLKDQGRTCPRHEHERGCGLHVQECDEVAFKRGFWVPPRKSKTKGRQIGIAVYKGTCKVGYVAAVYAQRQSLRRLVNWDKTTGIVQSINRGTKFGFGIVRLSLVTKTEEEMANDDEEKDDEI